MKGLLLFVTTAFLFVGIFFVLIKDIDSGDETKTIKKSELNFDAYSGGKGLTMREIDSLTAKYNYSFTKYNDPSYLAVNQEDI